MQNFYLKVICLGRKIFVDKTINQPTSRNILLDILKGLLIILVLLGHSIQYGSGVEFYHNNFWIDFTVRFIYSFHMPLFMAIAGYLCYFSLEKHGVWKYNCRRWIRLFPPIGIWSGCLYVLKCIIKHKTPVIIGFIKYLISTFWFLWALLIVGTIVTIVEKYNKTTKIIIYIVLIILSCITTDIYNLASYKFMFPCFLLGFYTAKYKLYIYLKNPVWIIISSLLWIILIQFFQKDTYIYTTGFSLLYAKLPLDKQIFVDIFRFVIAIVASISFVSICHFFKQKNWFGVLEKFLVYCGKHSLAIYILSTYIFVYVLPIFTKNLSSNYFYSISLLETTIILFICIFIQKILNKNKLLSRLIIGE